MCISIKFKSFLQTSDNIWYIYSLPTTLLQNQMETLRQDIVLMQPCLWYFMSQPLQLRQMQINSQRIFREKLRHLRIRPRVSGRITISYFLIESDNNFFPYHLTLRKKAFSTFLGGKKDNTHQVDIALDNFVCTDRIRI